MAFTGEIRVMPYTFIPITDAIWLRCDGKKYPIAQYPKLYEIIGYQFGGIGVDFCVPDLSERVVIGTGDSPEVGLNFNVGDQIGEFKVGLAVGQIPRHNHTLHTTISKETAETVGAPRSGYFLSRTLNQLDFIKDDVSSLALNLQTLKSVGQGEPHENRQPVTAMAYFICALGTYPTSD